MLSTSPARAALAGIVNSAFGFAIIALVLHLGANAYVANASGYVAGWCLSFLLYRYFVFASLRSGIRGEALRFVLAIVVSYGINLTVLTACSALPMVPPLLAQLISMLSYTATFYLVSRHFVFGTPHLRLNNTDWVRLCVAIAAIAILAVTARLQVSHDVVWQFWIARQMAHGADLYSDIIEVNPPLWFWMALWIHRGAALLGLAPILLLKALLIAWAALAVLLTDSLRREAGRLGPRIGLAVSFLVALTVLPLYDFGQREQLALIAALPYVALIAARSERCEIAPSKALIIGLLAAAGFALKHYFVVVPALLEVLLFALLRTRYRPIRPETLALAACAVAYLVAVLVLTPAFITDIVPFVTIAYGGYENPVSFQLIGRTQIVCYMAAVALIVYRTSIRPVRSEVLAYLAAAVGFAISFFAQQKGWQYHAIPVTGFLLIGLLVILTEGGKVYVVPKLVPLGVPTLLFAMWVHLWLIGPYQNPEQEMFDSATQGLAKHEVVYTFSNGPRLSWPMVEQKGFVWPSRYFALWPTGSLALTSQSDPRRPQLDRVADRLRNDVYQDLVCNPPERILVEYPMRAARLRKIGFHPRKFFEKDSRFKEIFAQYVLARRLTGTEVYFRRADAHFPAPSGKCRRMV